MAGRTKSKKSTKARQAASAAPPAHVGRAISNVVGELLNSFGTHSALTQMGELGAKLGEARFAARLAARATVFAALHTAPRKEGERSRETLVADAVAIVAMLEDAPKPPASTTKPTTPSAFGRLL